MDEKEYLSTVDALIDIIDNNIVGPDLLNTYIDTEDSDEYIDIYDWWTKFKELHELKQSK